MLSIELAPPDRRSQAASFILISFHVGMGIGPAAAEALLRRSSYAVVWLVVAVWATPTGVLLGAALLATGLALQSPSFIALAVDGVSARERGSAMATFTAFHDIANALIGPTMGLLVSGLSLIHI